MFVLRHGLEMMAHTFTGTTLRSLLGMESARAVFGSSASFRLPPNSDGTSKYQQPSARSAEPCMNAGSIRRTVSTSSYSACGTSTPPASRPTPQSRPCSPPTRNGLRDGRARWSPPRGPLRRRPPEIAGAPAQGRDRQASSRPAKASMPPRSPAVGAGALRSRAGGSPGAGEVGAVCVETVGLAATRLNGVRLSRDRRHEEAKD